MVWDYNYGGVNGGTRVYNDTIVNISGGQSTVTNTSSGQFIFDLPASRIVNFFGNLVNAGSITYIPTTSGGRKYVRHGNELAVIPEK